MASRRDRSNGFAGRHPLNVTPGRMPYPFAIASGALTWYFEARLPYAFTSDHSRGEILTAKLELLRVVRRCRVPYQTAARAAARSRRSMDVSWPKAELGAGNLLDVSPAATSP